MASRNFKRLLGLNPSTSSGPVRKRKSFRLDPIESLESRLVPATLYWIGTDNTGSWADPLNWAPNPDGSLNGTQVAPGAGDNAVFNNNPVFINGGMPLVPTTFGGGVTVNSVAFEQSPIIPLSFDAAGSTLTSLTVIGNPTLNGNTFADGGDVDAVDLMSGAGSVTIGGGLVIGPSTGGQAETWANNSTSAFTTTLTSKITYNNQLILAGTTTAPFLLGAGAGGTATGSGGLEVNGGWLEDANSAVLGASTSTIMLNSGKLSAASTTTTTLTQVLAIGGNITLGDPTLNGALTFTNASQTVTNTGDTITLAGGNDTFGTLVLPAGSNTTFANTLTSPSAAAILGSGLNLNGGADTLTFNTGTASASLNGALSNAGSLILAGSGTGAGGTGIIFNNLTGAPVTVNSTTGGEFQITATLTPTATILNAGTLNLNTSLVGSMTLNGGIIAYTSGTARTYGPTINGNVTINNTAGTGYITLANVPAITNPNVTLTFTGTKVTNVVGTFTVSASGFAIATAGLGGGVAFGVTSSTPTSIVQSNLILGTNDISIIDNGTGGFNLTGANTLTFAGSRTFTLSGTQSSGFNGTLAGSQDGGGTNPAIVLAGNGYGGIGILATPNASATFSGISVGGLGSTTGPNVAFGTTIGGIYTSGASVSTNNAFSGGVTLNSGTMDINAVGTAAVGAARQHHRAPGHQRRHSGQHQRRRHRVGRRLPDRHQRQLRI